MKHFRRITVARAEHTPGDVHGILDQVFGFVIALVEVKGKGRDIPV
jgi:hypothetical protein